MKMTEAPIRVLILDDHALFRNGVARAINEEPDLHTVAECGSVAEAVAFVREHPVDIVLLDLELEGQDGSAFLQSFYPDQRPKVLVVTCCASDYALRRLTRYHNIDGLLYKREPLTVLFRAIRTIAGGLESTPDDPWIRSMSRPALASTGDSGTKPLTQREAEVCRRVVCGLPSRRIADELHSTETAVKSIIQQLFQKTGTHSRAQLVRQAMEHYPELFDTSS